MKRVNDAHGFSATGTVPGSAVRQRRKRQRFASLFGQQCARPGQPLFAEAVGQQAIAADADEAFWQHMQEEAAEEVHGIKGHDALLAAVGIPPPHETVDLGRSIGLSSLLESAEDKAGQDQNPRSDVAGLDASQHCQVVPKGGERSLSLTSSFIG